MSRFFQQKMAKQKAESFLKAENITTLPVDPFAIAASRDIDVQAKPDTVKGVSGMLLRHGNTYGILYATDVLSEGFQRFSIAHELGHYFIDGHLDHVLPKDGVHSSNAGFMSGDPYELEADCFAAGLLMPADLFKRALNKHLSGLEAIEKMSEICRTSLTATAIRYAELTDDPIAIIVSTGEKIDFCFFSEPIKSLSDFTFLRKGTPVPKSTATSRFNASTDNILRSQRIANDVDVVEWLGGKRSITVAEEVIGLGGYGKTLTILSADSVGSTVDGYEDEDDEEAALTESWTPRFRK